MSLRGRVTRLERAAAERRAGTVPLVAALRRTGEGGETRAPGVYRAGPDGFPTVVYAGDGPAAADLAAYFPDRAPVLVGGEADPGAL